MKKKYEDFTKLKIKDMCKVISDMTYTYLQPDTHKPTEVPSKHYETILSEPIEEMITETIKLQQLELIYTNLVEMQKTYKEDFYKSLICIECGLNPKDLSIQERIGLDEIYAEVDDKLKNEKKTFIFLNENVINNFKKYTRDKNLHSSKFMITNPFDIDGNFSIEI